MVETQLLQDRYPNSPYADDSQMLIAAAYAFQGQREKAVEAYELLVKRWPDGDLAPRALVEEAKLFSDAGEHEKAIEVLVRALKAHPDPKTLQSEIARLRKKLAQLRGPSHIPGAAIWTEGPELPTHAGLE